MGVWPPIAFAGRSLNSAALAIATFRQKYKNNGPAENRLALEKLNQSVVALYC